MKINDTEMKRTFLNLHGEKIILTEGEMEIVSCLKRLEKLWLKHGDRLTLYNGNSLRVDGIFQQHEATSFSGIAGDGGDGGDFH